MKQNQVIVRMLMVLTIAFGVETAAQAQFGKLKGLAKKAKEAVKEQVGDAASSAVDNVSSESGVSLGEAGDTKSGWYPRSVGQISKDWIPYQPATEGDNAAFFDLNTPAVKAGYNHVSGARTMAEQTLRGKAATLDEFVKYNSSQGEVIVPIVEYPLTAYLAAFMTDPNNAAKYRYYVRANILHDAYRFGNVENAKKDNLFETEYNRFQRWSKVTGEASEIYDHNTKYETVGKAAVGTAQQIQKFIDEGNQNGAIMWMRELDYIMEDMEKHPKNPHEADYQTVVNLWKDLSAKTKDMKKDVATDQLAACEMPKAVNTSAADLASVTKSAKAEYGDKFVKAVITSGWSDYKSKEYPYPVTHRSCNIEIITKENGTYYTNRWSFLQNKSGNGYSNVGRLQAPIGKIRKQKVNYK